MCVIIVEYIYAMETRVSDYELFHLGTIPVGAEVSSWYVRRLQWEVNRHVIITLMNFQVEMCHCPSVRIQVVVKQLP